jgi:hypothetical protein
MLSVKVWTLALTAKQRTKVNDLVVNLCEM